MFAIPPGVMMVIGPEPSLRPQQRTPSQIGKEPSSLALQVTSGALRRSLHTIVTAKADGHRRELVPSRQIHLWNPGVTSQAGRAAIDV